MAKKGFLLRILAMALILVLVLGGCATNVATAKFPRWNKKTVTISGDRDYTIFGSVKLEKKWFGILGVSIIPFLGIDFYAYQSGGITYADLLEEAKKQYPKTDAVIDVTIEYANSAYAIFYSQRRCIITGLAVQFK